MALHWSLKDCEDFDALQRNWGFTSGLLMASIPLKLGRMTADGKLDGVNEWHYRLYFLERIGYPIFSKITTDGDDNQVRENYVPTLEELKPYIGMHMNVSCESRGAFEKHWLSVHKRDIKAAYMMSLQEG